MALLELRGVKKYYQQAKIEVPALRGIDLKVAKGEFTTIFGPPGSGKTTLLNIISCLDKPTSGTIYFEGKRLSGIDKEGLAQFINKNIGYVPQNNNLRPTMTIYQNIEYTASLSGGNGKELKNKVLKILHDVGLEKLGNKKPDELTDGQKKRAAVAIVMAKEPLLVLADEPTVNLDAQTGDKIMEIMVQMNEDLGITFIFSTYIPRIMDYAYRVIGIQDGLLINN